MSSVVEDKKRAREEEQESSNSNTDSNTDTNKSTNNFLSVEPQQNKKKKQVERKQWLKSRARKPRVGSDFQVNIASIPAFQQKSVVTQSCNTEKKPAEEEDKEE